MRCSNCDRDVSELAFESLWCWDCESADSPAAAEHFIRRTQPINAPLVAIEDVLIDAIGYGERNAGNLFNSVERERSFIADRIDHLRKFDPRFRTPSLRCNAPYAMSQEPHNPFGYVINASTGAYTFRELLRRDLEDVSTFITEGPGGDRCWSRRKLAVRLEIQQLLDEITGYEYPYPEGQNDHVTKSIIDEKNRQSRAKRISSLNSFLKGDARYTPIDIYDTEGNRYTALLCAHVNAGVKIRFRFKPELEPEETQGGQPR